MRSNHFTYLHWIMIGAITLFSGGLYAQKNKEIYVSPEKCLQHGFHSWNKNMVIDGEVRGDLFCLRGQTVLKGRVDGNITVVLGSLHVLPGAEIKGRIVTIGSPYVGPPQKDGKLLEFPLKNAFFPGESFLFEQIKRSAGRIGLGFLWVCMLLFFKPHRLREAGLEIRTDWLPTFFAGSFLLILFSGLFLGILLIFSHPVGPVLFIALFILLLAVFLFGLAGVFEALASILYDRLGMRGNYVHALFFAVCVVEILCLLPVVGFLIQFIILILGFGTTLLTRFGSNKAWFTRKKRVWPGS